MNATVEISLYPLHENFEQSVIDYIQELQKHSSLQVYPGGLSTVVTGPYTEMMNILRDLNEETLRTYRCVIHIKLAAGEKTYDKLPDILK